MHRRMSLGCALLLCLIVLVGAAPASAEPHAAAPRAAAVESVDLLGWVWDWLVSLAPDTGGGTSNPGGHTNSWDGGAFIDPLGGNS